MTKRKSSQQGDWERVWFATRQNGWTSLAVLPSDPSVEAGSVAQSLVATGQAHGERPVKMLNAQGVQLEAVHQLIGTLATMTAGGDLVIVSVDSIVDNPNTVPIVQATSGILLVVRLGESLLTPARTAIDVVGRERFLGSVIINGSNKKVRSLRFSGDR